MKSKEPTMEKMLFEMVYKIQKLEEKVENLENVIEKLMEAKTANSVQFESTACQRSGVNFTQSVRDYITRQKSIAKENGLKELIMVCNDIQKALRVSNVPRSVCVAMYDCMNPGDVVLSSPPSGYSTSVKVKYFLK